MQVPELKKARNNKAKSSHPGGDSALKSIEEDLLKWIFALREQGMAVSIGMVAVKASALLERDFSQVKSSRARYQIASRFVKRHGMTHRMGTHESQGHTLLKLPRKQSISWKQFDQR